MLSSDSTSDSSSECDSDSQLTPAAAGSTVHEEITPDVAGGSAEREVTPAYIEESDTGTPQLFSFLPP